MANIFVVDIPRNTWVDLYTATGIAVGTKLTVENIGSADVRLATQATQPAADHEIFNVLQRDNGVRLSNNTGDSGAWAFTYSGSSKVAVMGGAANSGFTPASISDGGGDGGGDTDGDDTSGSGSNISDPGTVEIIAGLEAVILQLRLLNLRIEEGYNTRIYEEDIK